MYYEEYKTEMEEFGNLVLPEKTFNICSMIERMFNISFSYDDITYYNRGGYSYAKAPGFSYVVCTSSLEEGPSLDYSEEIKKILKGLGFRLENSNGDNGMDSESNWHDTFWTYEFAYDSMIEYTF